MRDAEPQSPPEAQHVRFGRFEIDLTSGDLLRNGTLVSLAPQPLAVLRVLVDHAGVTVSRQQLRDEVWGSERHLQFEQSLNSCIRRLRAALEDDPHQPQFIQTVPRRGYRFVGLENDPGRHADRDSDRGQEGLDEQAAEAPLVGQQEAAAGARKRPPFVLWAAVTIGILVVIAALGLRRTAPTRVVEAAADTAMANTGTANPGLGDTFANTRVAPLTIVVLPFEHRGEMPTADQEGADAAMGSLATALGDELRSRLASLAPDRVRVLGAATSQALRNLAASREKGDEPKGEKPEAGPEGGPEVTYRLQGVLASNKPAAQLELSLVGPRGRITWHQRIPWDGAVSWRQAPSILLRATSAVAERLLGEAPSADAATSRSPAAREAYFRGRALRGQGTPEALARALDSLSEATSTDPAFTAAWAEQATVLSNLAWVGGQPDSEAIDRAREAIRRTLTLDPDNPEALFARATLLLFHDWQPDAARAALERASGQAPEQARLHSGLAAALAAVGRTDEAVAAARLAEALDPLNMVVLSDLCWYLVYDGQDDEAALGCSRALRFAPTNSWIRLGLTMAYGHDRPQDAVGAWLDLLAGSDAPVADWRARDPGQATATLTEILAWFAERQHVLLQRGQGQALNAAGALAVAGRTNEALTALEQAIEERQGFVVFLPVDPRFDGLRDLPAFQVLLRRLRYGTPVSTSG